MYHKKEKIFRFGLDISKCLWDKGVQLNQNGYNANIHNQMLLRYTNSQHPCPKASTFIAF